MMSEQSTSQRFGVIKFLSDWVKDFTALIFGVLGAFAWLISCFYVAMGWAVALVVMFIQPWWVGILAWLSWLAAISFFAVLAKRS